MGNAEQENSENAAGCSLFAVAITEVSRHLPRKDLKDLYAFRDRGFLGTLVRMAGRDAEKGKRVEKKPEGPNLKFVTRLLYLVFYSPFIVLSRFAFDVHSYRICDGRFHPWRDTIPDVDSGRRRHSVRGSQAVSAAASHCLRYCVREDPLPNPGPPW